MCSSPLTATAAIAARIRCISNDLSNSVEFHDVVTELNSIADLLEATPPPGVSVRSYIADAVEMIKLIEVILRLIE